MDVFLLHFFGIIIHFMYNKRKYQSSEKLKRVKAQREEWGEIEEKGEVVKAWQPQKARKPKKKPPPKRPSKKKPPPRRLKRRIKEKN